MATSFCEGCRTNSTSVTAEAAGSCPPFIPKSRKSFLPVDVGVHLSRFVDRMSVVRISSVVIYPCRTVAVFGFACLVFLTAAFGQTPQSGIAPARDCSSLTGFRIPDSTMIITKAAPVPTAPPNTINRVPDLPFTIPVAIPSYCRAEGVIDERTGADRRSFAIGFAIALPDRWSGQFLYQGGGGLNGSIDEPYGVDAAGDVPGLARGMAVVSTDTGHKSSVFDASFMKDQQAALDFTQAAVPRVTLVAKQIITYYYGQPAGHSYFAGCSTGGREGSRWNSRGSDSAETWTEVQTQSEGRREPEASSPERTSHRRSA